MILKSQLYHLCVNFNLPWTTKFQKLADSIRIEFESNFNFDCKKTFISSNRYGKQWTTAEKSCVFYQNSDHELVLKIISASDNLPMAKI